MAKLYRRCAMMTLSAILVTMVPVTADARKPAPGKARAKKKEQARPAAEPVAPEPPPVEPRPWAEGVSPERQESALAQFSLGNAKFVEGNYAEALTIYREALVAWDHPSIRLNIAVCLINLEQPLAAAENLEAALAYGRAPFDDEAYAQALTYDKLLAGQLARLRIACAEPGAEVLLDGKRLFTAPGEHEVRITPGTHQLVATKRGLVSATESITVAPGRVETARLTLLPIEKLIETRRWPTWKPWTVMGVGAGLALVGVPFQLAARSNFADFDAGVAMCAATTGCQPGELPSRIADLEGRAQNENRAAVALFALGGATVAIGITMLILNQPRAVPKERRGKESTLGSQLEVSPILGAGTHGIRARITF